MLNKKELNERIDTYLKENNNLFYLNNLTPILHLLEQSKSLINPYEELGTNCIAINYHDKIDGLTSFELVREYLYLLNPKYQDIFTKCLNNGTFGFADTINDEVDYLTTNCSGRKDKHLFFNVGFEGNILDGKILVHEFFHYLNTANYASRELFTEFISIYNENKFLDYLKTKGYSDGDITKAKLERYLGFYRIINPLYYETLILNIGSLIGDFDYNFLMKYKDVLSFPSLTFEKWEEVLDTFLDKLKKCDEPNHHNQEKVTPDISYRYFLGTVLSCYLLTHEDENTHKRVLELNDKLASGLSLADSFNILELDLNNISSHDLVASVNNYYDKILTKEQEHQKIKIRSS